MRDAARQLVANSKRVDATKAARVLAERRLEAEEKKFAAGMSTSFVVFQAQRDLAQARSNELRAVLDYNKSQVDFETVQIAPVNGGGVSTVGGTSTTLGGAVTSRNRRRRQRHGRPEPYSTAGPGRRVDGLGSAPGRCPASHFPLPTH